MVELIEGAIVRVQDQGHRRVDGSELLPDIVALKMKIRSELLEDLLVLLLLVRCGDEDTEVEEDLTAKVTCWTSATSRCRRYDT